MKKYLALVIVSWLLVIPVKAAIISQVEPTSVADSSFIITWTTTDEAASTELLWGIGGLTNVTTISGTTQYHYAELSGLYANTTYQYRLKSGSTLFPPLPLSPLTFTTLEKPSGVYLFSFAVLNDLRYAESKSDVVNARGVPYSKAAAFISAEVADINTHSNIAFTVINGNLADAAAPAETYNAQLKTNLKALLENLNSTGGLGVAGYKYLPTTGFNDKQAAYTTAADDWLSDSFLPLTTNPGTTESRYTTLYGYNAASRDADSFFNYSFNYNSYNFIFLDSVRKNGTGTANLAILHQLLSAESNTKTFIFSCYPAYNPFDASTKDYPADIPTSEIGGAICLDNHEAFRATIEAFNDNMGNPIVGAVISSHLGDNYLRTMEGISYVRQGPALQYPTGYSIYKVYTNGYVKTFYKTTGRDTTGLPYYEYARNLISEESGLAAEVLSALWLGSNSQRNFTVTYPFIPGVPPVVMNTSPVSGESAVALNRPIMITFSESLYNDSNLNDWVTITSGGTPVTGLTITFANAAHTVLKVVHPDFVLDQSYAVTILSSKVRDEGSTYLASDYSFTFNTNGGHLDETPPTASVSSLPDNLTTDPFPSFIGLATDESGVANVEFRFDGSGAWQSAEAVDGAYNQTTEVFTLQATSGLAAGSHHLDLRTTDNVGNTSVEGFIVYAFSVASSRPQISVRINGAAVITGDPISATPKIELTVTSASTLNSGRLAIGQVSRSLTFTASGGTYYATEEITTALADGSYCLTVEAFDSAANGSTNEVAPLFVQSAAQLTAQGSPLNYPNPFAPGAGNVTIGYTLSKAANLNLSLYDLNGSLITRRELTANSAGGRAGYNEVTWDGKADNGRYVGNGIYIYFLVSDGKVIQNGKGKITVFR